MDNSGDIGRNSSTVLVEIAGHHPHPVYSDQDGPGASAKLSSINGLWNVGSACFIADESILRLYTPAQEFQNWMEILCDGHKAYGLVEKRLSDLESDKCLTTRRLKRWIEEKPTLKRGKVKSLRDHREIKPLAWESRGSLYPTPWKMQEHPQKERQA